MQKSWIPHSVTCFLWASSRGGITLSVWLLWEGTFVLSFTVNMPGEFLWSVTGFIVVWALHICETQLFLSPLTQMQNRWMFLWNGCDICVGVWELRLNHRIFSALCPSLLLSLCVCHSTWMSNRHQWEWYWGSLLTSDSVCDTATSSYTDIEEISVTPASTSFFDMCLNSLGVSGLMPQINPIDRDELSNGIKGRLL